MRVALLTELYLPNYGGMEVRLAELAAALTSRGHEVVVLCIGHETTLPETEVMDGILVRRHPLVADYRKSAVPGMPRGVIPILRYSRWCRRVTRQEPFDVYIFNEFPFGHILAARKRVRARAIIDWAEVRSSPPFRLLQRFIPRMSARNTATSMSVAAEIEAQSGRTVDFVPSGITLDRYRNEPRKLRSGLLYIGRLRPHKRLPLLVQAFEQLRRNGFPETLTIAGVGESAADVHAAVGRLGSGEQEAVNVPGAIDDGEKIRLLASSSVLVMPSEREGFPLAVAEAMASGLPVVTTDDKHNGTVDVIHEHKSGVVCEATPTGLADGISTALADWDRLSTNALAGAAHLDWARVVSRIEDMASSLVSAST